MPKPISTTMKCALQVAAKFGGVLERRPGGFWTYPTCGWADSLCRTPSWHVGTQTVNSLLSRKLAEPVAFMSRGDPWKVMLTPAGREILGDGAAREATV